MSDNASDNDRVLPYAAAKRWITVQRFTNEIEAQLCGNQLEDQSIHFQLLNAETRSTLAMYGAMVNIELQVLEQDLPLATKIVGEALSHAAADRLVPADADDSSIATVLAEPDGSTVRLLSAGVFPTVHAMRAAMLTLEAAHIEAFPPRLIDAPPDASLDNLQFVLRVREDDWGRAQLLVRPTRDKAGEIELCCPRCGGWKIFEMNHEIKNMFLAVAGRKKSPECECLTCHFVGVRSEFEGGGSTVT